MIGVVVPRLQERRAERIAEIRQFMDSFNVVEQVLERDVTAAQVTVIGAVRQAPVVEQQHGGGLAQLAREADAAVRAARAKVSSWAGTSGASMNTVSIRGTCEKRGIE